MDTEEKLKSIDCPTCKGTGWNIKDRREVCQNCFGRGFMFVKDDSVEKKPLVPVSPYD